MDEEIYQLAAKTGAALRLKNARVATAESCTGGWIAQALTSVPGSSQWFELGVVSYSDRMKETLLAVPRACFAGPTAPGAVSEATIRAMATGALLLSGADYAIASSGVAGPDGGSPAKPVGTVWLAWAARGAEHDDCEALCYVFDGDRFQIRRQSVIAALMGLLQRI
jgi:nicotinamide-nucleotide amidase